MTSLGAPSEMQNARSNAWRAAVPRPPWTDERLVREKCTSCGDCIRACPESILFAGPANTPTIDFKAGGCVFCGDCALACNEGVFRDTDAAPWTLVATVRTDCFLNRGVSCQSCTDACDETAIIFDIRAGKVGAVKVVAGECTGCGACVGSCPASAIHLISHSQQGVAV
ncbi:MAG: 4Fe-4S dicluster domain-containing protein [Boseongicola sp.]|nr:MAG: 4Fe-4S dicluster domain-containing protein [Boseongicola sp.]